jgi:hypothetical protein
MDHWQSDTDKGKQKSLEKSLSECHFFTTKPTSNRGERSATNCLNRDTKCELTPDIKMHKIQPGYEGMYMDRRKLAVMSGKKCSVLRTTQNNLWAARRVSEAVSVTQHCRDTTRQICCISEL